MLILGIFCKGDVGLICFFVIIIVLIMFLLVVSSFLRILFIFVKRLLLEDFFDIGEFVIFGVIIFLGLLEIYGFEDVNLKFLRFIRLLLLIERIDFVLWNLSFCVI